MDISNELQLVELAKKDIKAFNKLYEYYLPKIFGYCINRLANRVASEEITSIVFLEAVKQIKKFDTKRGIKFGSWLFRVTHNKIVDYHRKKSHEARLTDEMSQRISETFDNSNLIKKIEAQKDVSIVLKRIKPKYANILSLKYYSDLSNEEIAEVLKTNKNNIAVLIHRALKAFEAEYLNVIKSTE